jgi:hypothetical protein
MCQNAAATVGGCAALDHRPRAAGHAPSLESGWRSAALSSLSDASELLDRLEACGFREREFAVLGESSFEVRWR